MQWEPSDTVVGKLKEMSWGLQALRIFDLKLQGALGKIKEATDSLESTINMVSQADQAYSTNHGTSVAG